MVEQGKETLLQITLVVAVVVQVQQVAMQQVPQAVMVAMDLLIQ
jgi:hypothetical protein